MIQVIVCKCGSDFAACREPECYTGTLWHKNMRKYVDEGCTVKMIESGTLNLQECICNKQPDLFTTT